jgi:hypothetical protein
MISGCRRQVGAALAAVGTDAAGRPTWLGRPVPLAAGEESGEAFPIASLASVLYRSFYCRGGIACPDVALSTAGPGQRRRLLESLAASVPDRHRWDDGWRFLERHGATLVVEKQGIEIRVNSTEWWPEEDGRHSGSRGRLRVPADRWDTTPGFLLVHGERLPSADPDCPRSRIYLDLDLDGAYGLLEATGAWNAAGIPFVVKVPADPYGYERCDTGVVILERGDFDRARDAIVASADLWRPGLRPATPAFARRIGPGVAVTDDPPGGRSFGMLRSRQLAEGIARATRDGARSPDERLRIVEALFAEAGVSLDALHLAPASRDYDLGPWNPLAG